MAKPLDVGYYSDVLCVWAYVAQIRLDELKQQWPQLAMRYYFIDVFGCTAQRIGEGWRERGGYEAFGEHVQEVCHGFDHLALNPAVWRDCRPATSANAHLVLKAAQLLLERGVIDDHQPSADIPRNLFEELAWQIRLAFFRDARDIGQIGELLEIASELGVPARALRDVIESGEAMAALLRDESHKVKFKLEGSPTFLMNEGRQKLYGNVGYRILEANVQELLERPSAQASWC